MALETVFKSFCSFGAGKDRTAQMDNAKFAKLFRDLKLLDKKFTSTDVDIIFNRTEVKPKTERKINFRQFQKAIALVAEKKYPGDTDGVKKLEGKMIDGDGPGSSSPSSKVKNSGVVDRLTDSSKYTGSHKERFDETGKGKGLEGRDTVVKGSGMAAGCVAGQPGYVSGYKNEGTHKLGSSSSNPKVKNSGVVDRLTDSSKYTGSHKERFDESGRGRGLEGRDIAMTSGTVGSQTAYVSGYKNEGTYKK